VYLCRLFCIKLSRDIKLREVTDRHSLIAKCTRRDCEEIRVISGLRRDVDEVCALLGYYAF
jgi:hypothetical protein